MYKSMYRLFPVSSPKAEMTFPRQTRDLLMLPPSFSLIPSAPVRLTRSLNKEKRAATVEVYVLCCAITHTHTHTHTHTVLSSSVTVEQVL